MTALSLSGISHAGEWFIRREPAIEFAKIMKANLNPKGSARLSKLFFKSPLWFPEQEYFGCKTADSRRLWITPKEFTTCMFSPSPDSSGPGKERLLGVMSECFSAGTEYDEESSAFVAKKGFRCVLEGSNQKQKFGGITLPK